MKFIVAFSCIILVSFAVTTCYCNPAPAVNNQGFGYGQRQKPGTCYRPRYRRSLIEDGEEKHEVKRQAVFGFPGGNGIIGGGGTQGGNWKPTPTPGWGWGSRPQCYRDYDCSGNKKCCNGNCQTPSFVG